MDSHQRRMLSRKMQRSGLEPRKGGLPKPIPEGSGTAKKEPEHRSHEWIVWIVALGLPGLAVGGGATLMGAVNYWAGFVITELGLVCFLFAWLYIKKDVSSVIERGVAIIIVCAAAWLCWFVFRPAPLTFQLSATKAVYPEGSVIDGIKWYTECVDARIFVTNPSDRDYDDADFSLSANDKLLIMGMGKETSIDVQFFPEDLTPPPGQVIEEPDSAGNIVRGPGRSSGWAYHYRIRIPKIPRKSSIELVAALAWLTPPPHDRIVNNKLLGPQRLPSSVRLIGDFKASSKPIHVDVVIRPITGRLFDLRGVNQRTQ